MSISVLREEISIELKMMGTVVAEAVSLLNDIEEEQEPSVRGKTAAAAFLAQFYGGMKDALKRHKQAGNPVVVMREGQLV